MMYQARDIAKYVIWLAAREPEMEVITQMRLHKLLYYIEGWSLACRGRSIFRDTIKAWKHGPVVSGLYREYSGYGNAPIDPGEGDEGAGIAPEDRAFVESVWEHYKQFSATELRRRTHMEKAWLSARGELPEEVPGDAPIARDEMEREFRAMYDREAMRGLELSVVEASEREVERGETVSLDEAARRLGVRPDEL